MCLLVTAAAPPFTTLLVQDFGRSGGWLYGGVQKWVLNEVLILVDQLLNGAFFRMKGLARGFVLECITVFV